MKREDIPGLLDLEDIHTFTPSPALIQRWLEALNGAWRLYHVAMRATGQNMEHWRRMQEYSAGVLEAQRWFAEREIALSYDASKSRYALT